MPLLYNFDVERPEELLAILAQSSDAYYCQVRTKAYYFISILCGISKSVGLFQSYQGTFI